MRLNHPHRWALTACLAAGLLAGAAGATDPSPEPSPDPPMLDAEQQAAIDAKLDAFDAEVRARRAAFYETLADPSDTAWVQSKLAHMVDVDQFMRTEGMSWTQEAAWSDAQKEAFQSAFGSRWSAIDAEHTETLKWLIAVHGWPTISEFGKEAEHHAWLLVQHADLDRAFQKHVLGILEGLLEAGETSKKSFAYLYDRVASAEDRPQRYGTQGRCVGTGDWDPNPLEDPERIDAIRESVGLEPLADYEQRFVDLCP